MKNNFFKKIYYSLLRNISWYEINNKNDIKKQIKIEQKILELLNSKSFKITNTNYLSRNEIPVYSLPNFLVINWPKGIDDSYFKSYQVIDYFKDIGMVKFKLTLSHDVSKEFNLKGFDNWQDILKNCENIITKQFDDEKVLSYLSSSKFKVSNGKVFDYDLNQLIKPILQNQFIKLNALKLNIVAIDYLKEEYTLQINWDLDPKFQLSLHLNSKYIAYINEQTRLLSEFINNNEIVRQNIYDLDFSKINDANYLNDIWKKDLTSFNQYHTLKVSLIHIDYTNAKVLLNFYDQANQINAQNEFVILALKKLIDSKKYIQTVINNLQFLNTIKELFLNNNLNEQNIIDILNKYGIDYNEYILKWNKNINIPVLLIEIAHKNNQDIFVSNKITLPETYHNYADKYISPSEYNELTYNDLSFLQIIVKQYKYLQANKDIYQDLITKYKAEWKDILNNYPFYIEYENTKNDDNVHLILTIISQGSRISKEIYSIKPQEDLVIDYGNLITKNEAIVQYLTHLSFSKINEIKPKINEIIKEILLKNNLYINQFNDIEISLKYEKPYNHFEFEISDLKNPSVKITKYLNVDIKTYNSLNWLFFNTGFITNLTEFLQYLFNSDNYINKEELNNLFTEKINGINLTNIDYIKQDINETSFKLIINFKYLFPNIELEINKLNTEVNINDIINEFSIALANDLKYESNDEHIGSKEEFKLDEVVKRINQDKFNILNNYDGIVSVTWNTQENPMISFEIQIPKQDIYINDYTYNLSQLKSSYDSLKQSFDNKIKEQLIAKIASLKEVNYASVKELCDQLFLNNKYKWFKLNKLSFFSNDANNIDVFFNKELIGTLD